MGDEEQRCEKMLPIRVFGAKRCGRPAVKKVTIWLCESCGEGVDPVPEVAPPEPIPIRKKRGRPRKQPVVPAPVTGRAPRHDSVGRVLVGVFGAKKKDKS